MNSSFLSDEEYDDYWVELGGLRKVVCERLKLVRGMRVLDVGAGWGYFTIEVLKQLENGEVVGIDLKNSAVKIARKTAQKYGGEATVSFRKMDATKLDFQSGFFDVAASFLSMRDIYMTRGKQGVKLAVEEMIRVVKQGGKIALCVTPPEDMGTEDQMIAVKLEEEIFGAESLPKRFYLDVFRENNVSLYEVAQLLTGKKLTAKQAKIEIKEGIDIANRVYRRKTPQIKEVWGKYGVKIREVGYGMYSKIVMIVARKL